MKKSILGLLLTLPLISAIADDCITNVSIACLNGWACNIGNTEGASGTCWNAAVTYTNISCRELLASGGGGVRPCTFQPFGTFIMFTYQGTNCPTFSSTVATVTYTCNTNVPCVMTQGGPSYCNAGSSFNVSIDAGVTSFIGFIVPGSSVCCSAVFCELSGSRVTCIPPDPGN